MDYLPFERTQGNWPEINDVKVQIVDEIRSNDFARNLEVKFLLIFQSKNSYPLKFQEWTLPLKEDLHILIEVSEVTSEVSLNKIRYYLTPNDQLTRVQFQVVNNH